MFLSAIPKEDAEHIEQMLVDLIDYGEIVKKDECNITCSIPEKKIHDSQAETISENLSTLNKNYSYTIYIDKRKMFINVYRY